MSDRGVSVVDLLRSQSATVSDDIPEMSERASAVFKSLGLEEEMRSIRRELTAATTKSRVDFLTSKINAIKAMLSTIKLASETTAQIGESEGTNDIDSIEVSIKREVSVNES